VSQIQRKKDVEHMAHPDIAARCRAVLECPLASKELRDAAHKLLRAPPPPAQQRLSDPPATAATAAAVWTCRSCTLVNGQANASCSACGATRPLVVGAAWSCRACTFVNRAQRSKCEVCAEPRHAPGGRADGRAEGGGGGAGKAEQRKRARQALAIGDDDFAST